jgi:putative ABC transport system ATP-binding protein
LLVELNQTHNTTFIFASHDPGVISRAHRLIQMQDGRVATDEIKG